jgi:putative Mn2+ efflux pump MntP
LSWLIVLGMSLGLAMDAFAVSIATGLAVAPATARHTFRIAFHFGLFQFLMPVAGWLAGKGVASWIQAWDHWVAFGLLGYVGGKMLKEAWRAGEEKPAGPKVDPTRGWRLVTLSVATSLDALAVGFTMALVEAPIWAAAVVIGIVAAALSTAGMLFGSRLGRRWGRWAEVAGGIVLVAIGVKILLTV